MYNEIKFKQEAKSLVDCSLNYTNFKWNFIKIENCLVYIFYKKGIDMMLLKSNIIKKEYLIEFHILYSEIYQTPVLYFLIYDTISSKYIEFDEFKYRNITSNNYIISKSVISNNIESSNQWISI